MTKGSRRGCIPLKKAILGIDDEEDSTFTIHVDGRTFHFQGRQQPLAADTRPAVLCYHYSSECRGEGAVDASTGLDHQEVTAAGQSELTHIV